METVVVLMSTYNGEKYLQEQLDSIIAQKGVDVRLVIRDDGSTDNTVSILRHYVLKYPNITILEGKNIGCKYSFYECAKYAYQKFDSINYFAFSDQDDFWFPDKLIVALNSLSNMSNKDQSLPLLYYCNTTRVDMNLNILPQNTEFASYQNFIKTCISYSASGCTMVFNRIAIDLFLKANPAMMYLHDSWLYKTVDFCNGIIFSDSESYIYYRQHENNVVGAKLSKLDSWKRRFHSFTMSRCQRSNELKNILKTYSFASSSEKIAFLTLLTNYKFNLCNKLKIMFSSKILSESKTPKYFKIAIFLNLF